MRAFAVMRAFVVGLLLLATSFAWADVEFVEFGVGSWVFNPDDRDTSGGFQPGARTMPITQYIAGVAWAEIGQTWAPGDPPNLREGFIAQAVAARSNLAHYNRNNSRTGGNSYEDARIPPLSQAYVALPESEPGSEYIKAVVTDTFSSNILTLNDNRVFAPFGAKLIEGRTFTWDSDIKRKYSNEPHARKVFNVQTDYESQAAPTGGEQVGLQQAGAMWMSNFHYTPTPGVNSITAEQILRHYYGLKPPCVMSVEAIQGDETLYAAEWTEDAQALGRARLDGEDYPITMLGPVTLRVDFREPVASDGKMAAFFNY